jgi:hypothetical protein
LWLSLFNLCKPRQLVIVVAEGVNPQVIEFGTSYIRKAFEQEEATAVEELETSGKTQTGEAGAQAALQGVLKAASANGYKTGLVTTGDVTAVAPLYLGLLSNGSDAARALVTETQLDFLAGGGRSYFVSNKIPGSKRNDDFDASKAIRDAGGTVYFNLDSLDEEAKGRVLALQSDAELSYALDRDEETESGFDELVTLALDTLGGDNNAPFVLVVHDTLMAKALAARDTPAVVEQFHTLDNILGVVQSRREDNPADLGLAFVATGGAVAPRFTTDKADERSNSIFILSNLPLSYSGVGARLKGADDALLTAFVNEKYKGWKLSLRNAAAF